MIEIPSDWHHVNPEIKTVPMDWHYQIPYGVIYRRNASANVKQFIMIIKQQTAVEQPGK